MDLSFLVILNIIVLYYILRQHKRDCIPCKYIFVSILGIILGLYEIYMTLSYKKFTDKKATNTKNKSTEPLNINDVI